MVLLQTKDYPDAMVDVETTGLRADRHAMIQISVVPFNLQTGEVSDLYFDKCMRIPAARGWQEGTRSWWYGNHQAVLNGIMHRMEDPKTVMSQLMDDFCPEFLLKKDCRFWMKRPFDWQFVESYCNDLEVGNFFKYTNVMEMTAFMKGMAFPDETTEGLTFPDFRAEIPHVETSEEYDAHNAHYDCVTQINKLIGMSKYYGAVV